MQTLLTIAYELSKDIGAHNRADYLQNGTADAWYESRVKSDAAVSLAKYLIMHLDSRHHAAVFASAVGMPGYMNMR